MTSEPAAPYAEATLLRPRYRPSRNFPRLKSRAVIIAPIQTSRQVIFTSGRTLKIMANNSVMTPNETDRKSTRLNSSHLVISYAVFCLKKKKKKNGRHRGGACRTDGHHCCAPRANSAANGL